MKTRDLKIANSYEVWVFKRFHKTKSRLSFVSPLCTLQFCILFLLLRYAENHCVLGLVLVSACVTDLGDPNEKASGKGKLS